jgi:hypothetical protein
MNPTPAPIAGGGGVVGSFQQDYNTAWYAWRPAAMQPLYYGRPGVPIPQGSAPLNQTQFQALIDHLVANVPVNPVTGALVPIVEIIDYEGADPWTMNYVASQSYGDTWWPAGQGSKQSTQVIQMGQYGGTPPAGTAFTPIIMDISLLTPWPSSTPPTSPVIINDLVGIQELPGEFGPVPGISLGPNTPYPVGYSTSDSRGNFKVAVAYNMFGATYFWQLQVAAPAGGAS